MDETNQNQQQNNYGDYQPQTPQWRVYLGIFIAIIAVIRLVYTCSGARERQAQRQTDEFRQMLQETQSQYENLQSYRINQAQRISNEILYTSYKDLGDLTDEQIATYKLMKIEKDSMMRLDLTNQLKLDKNSYLQKNHDDSLRMAIKTPDDMTFFIHDFPGKGDIKFNFIEMKRRQDISDIQEESLMSSKTFSYTIKQNDRTFNGYAIASHENGNFFFMEFESDKIKKDALKIKAISYLATHLQSTKR